MQFEIHNNSCIFCCCCFVDNRGGGSQNELVKCVYIIVYIYIKRYLNLYYCTRYFCSFVINDIEGVFISFLFRFDSFLLNNDCWSSQMDTLQQTQYNKNEAKITKLKFLRNNNIIHLSISLNCKYIANCVYGKSFFFIFY